MLKSGKRKALDFLTLGIFSGLPWGDAEKARYVEGLLGLKESQRFTFSHFFMNLDVLDNKANSMIQFSSVIFALYAASLGFYEKTPSLKGVKWIGQLLIAGQCMSFISVFLLLLVVSLHWSGPDELANEFDQALKLLKVRDKRTIRYRVAWLLAMGATIMLAVSVVVMSSIL